MVFENISEFENIQNITSSVNDIPCFHTHTTILMYQNKQNSSMKSTQTQIYVCVLWISYVYLNVSVCVYIESTILMCE